MIHNKTKFNTEWDTFALNDLGIFKRGRSKHRPRNDPRLFAGGTHPLVQTGEIKAVNLYIKSHQATYNDEGLKQSKMWDAGTLCITIAANIAETGILAYPMCFPDSVVGFVAYKEKTSELFMHYVFAYIKTSIQNSALGSIQDNINIELLTALTFKIPKKRIQDKIAELLATIDKKIELNNQINAELEAIAKAIYDYWFVQFDFPDEEGKPFKTSGGEMEYNEELKREIPKGWEVTELSRLVSRIGTGLNPRDNFMLGSGSNYYVTIKNIDYGKIYLDERCDRISDNALQTINRRSNLSVGDVLFTSIEPVGRTYLIQEEPVNWNINESVFTIRCNQEFVTPEFLYLWLSSDEMKIFAKNVSTGSIHKGARIGMLNTFRTPYAGREVVHKFSKTIGPMLKKINAVQKENQELIRLRDFLLPLLMNGQVKVR